MRGLKYVIPIMILVMGTSWVMLSRNHQEVSDVARVLITIGATIVSGVISYFLFPKEEGEEE
ncbi:histidine kinase [Sporosarcina sp. CAU 1771]